LIVRLLLTRPQADSLRTATALQQRGHQSVVAPLLEIKILPQAELGPGPWAALLVTSVNAVRALAGHPRRDDLRDIPVFAVGSHSAQAVRDLGFAAVSSADGDVTALAALVTARLKPPMHLLYLAGETRAGDLAGLLRAQKFTVDTVLIYRAVATAALPAAAIDALTSGIDGVLHFSRRSADAYLQLAHAAGLYRAALEPIQLCLSSRIASTLRSAGAAQIRVAASPDEDALLRLCDQGM
jgi:uroporphyrinogen-III synthase